MRNINISVVLELAILIHGETQKGTQLNGIHIRQAMGGFIIDDIEGERVATTLDEVLNFLLLHFEGKASTFTGDLYGYVCVARGTNVFVLEPTPALEPPNTGSEEASLDP